MVRGLINPGSTESVPEFQQADPSAKQNSDTKGDNGTMSSKMKLKSKVGTLADIEKFIKPGDFVAIGGGVELQQTHGNRPGNHPTEN
jgi:hypothetical protein